MIRIVTDSSADISQTEAKELGITVMPLTINFEEGSYLDGVEILPDEFYKKLVTCKTIPSTAQASPADYEKIFEEARQAGDTVILLPISRKISGSHNCAHMVKNQGGYDNVYIVDTLCTVSFLRIMVLEALRLKDTMSPEDIMVHLEELRKKIRLYALVDTLEYLHKGGRVSRASATIGILLNIKPIVTITDGEVKVIAKPISARKAIDYLVDKKRSANIDTNYPIICGYSGDNTRCKAMIDKMFDTEEEKDYYLQHMQNVSPIVGVHTGPNVAVVVYVEK